MEKFSNTRGPFEPTGQGGIWLLFHGRTKKRRSSWENRQEVFVFLRSTCWGAGDRTKGFVIKGLIIELTRPKSVSVSVSVSERKTPSFTATDTHTDTVSGDGDVVIVMRPSII